jgi:hypothetical protein
MFSSCLLVISSGKLTNLHFMIHGAVFLPHFDSNSQVICLNIKKSKVHIFLLNNRVKCGVKSV